jgi:hypothetical protein
MHGMNSSADSWLNDSPGTMLPLLLADVGYEVFVCNNRGVFDYCGHKELNPELDDGFWDYDWQTMASEDLSAITAAVVKNQAHPDGEEQLRKLTFVGLQSAAYQMLDSLARWENEIQYLVDKAIFLAPTFWMELPGPSFSDPVMKQIQDLKPPYVGGNNWQTRRTKICTRSGNAKLCEHPFMSADL